jgi:hypothetical protein
MKNILRIVATFAVCLYFHSAALAQHIQDHDAGQPVVLRDIAPMSVPAHPSIIPNLHLPAPIAPPVGLRMEMSFAPPVNDIPTDPYQMGKYGRLSVDYTRLGRFDGGDIGVMVQALHVAHHLLFYSAGFTSDINNDGIFLLTAGLAHYQTGNAPTEPFVDAPFVRLRMQSLSEDRLISRDEEAALFFYTEMETTMHFREYLSGVAGLGLRISPMVRLIGGFQHTEFVMPTEHQVRMVEGLQGILQWGM